MQLAKRIDPSEYILSLLPKEERLEITFRIAQEAFKRTNLSLEDIEEAVKKIRKKLYKGGKKSKGHN